MELKQQQQGMDALKQFWRWWSAELYQLAPPKLRGYFSGHTGTLEIRVEEAVARFQLITDKAQRLLGVIDLESAADEKLIELKRDFLVDIPEGISVEIYLPAEKLLVSSQFLPLATEPNIDNVLQFEIDRLTPFHADQASLGYRVTGRYPENEKIQLQLYTLPRDYLERLLERLQLLGLKPDAIWPTLEAEARKEPSLNLLPPERCPAVESIWNSRARQFGTVALLVLLAVMIYPAYQLDRNLVSMQQRVSEIRQQATVVGGKQSLLASRLAAQDTLVLRKNQSPGKLIIVHEVTRLLPDNTWVSRLNIDNQEVSLQGESRKASDMIELLEKSPQFQNVEFASSITRNAATNMERYEVRMNLGDAP